MPSWTKEQELAIKEEGCNIIVSAGAGSGKTEVLSERVIYKLKKGIKVNELLILTFTNAAAAEMKARIRKKIKNYPELKDNLDLLENAYITTFDSFTLSLVKKYHYVLNVSSHINIIDESIISIIKSDFLDEVFVEFYQNPTPYFQKLIKDFTIKDDKLLKNYLLGIFKNLELKSDLDYYLENYLASHFNEKVIEENIENYTKLLHAEIYNIENNLMLLENFPYPEFYDGCVKALTNLINSKTYDEIKQNIMVKLPRRPSNSEDIKEYKDNIDESLKNLKNYLRFTDVKEIYESFAIIKNYIIAILDICKKYFQKLNAYKKEQDLYEFQDVAIMAIQILKNNNDIRNEIKNYYQEIFVDEYQDTSELQEEFINLIANNNVYMVGDIKQSIYRFRNASPNIFREKYNQYKKEINGKKIDLLKNFRSRNEVLNGINDIFNLVMDDALGGASYKLEHQMNFGNSDYLQKEDKQDYNLEILNYDNEDKTFSNEEIEAFIIAKDILNKIENNYKVFDKKTKNLRKVNYEDFCIIMDRESAFPLYKKIFEYLKVPLTIKASNKLTNELDIMLINNLLGFLLKVSKEMKDIEFKYYFMSIARSYLFNYDDDKIFEIIKNDKYEEDEIYKKAYLISKNIQVMNSYEILDLIIKDFNVYESLIKMNNIEESIIRINNILDIAKNLSEMGYTITMFKDYLTKMIEGKNEIKYNFNNKNSSSVTIMNIHKSKGLEFPICYYSGYYKEFNKKDLNDRFVFDSTYGIITPYFKEGINYTILKDLYKEKYHEEDISEKIRLLYVALTRAKEKIIIVSPTFDNDKYVNNLVDFNIRKNYHSFYDILSSINLNMQKYIKLIDLNTMNLTKDYLYDNEIISSKNDLTKSDIIQYKTIHIPNQVEENKHASKIINGIIDKENNAILKKGTLLHKYFEQTDFLNIAYDNPYRKQIEAFVKKLNITKDTLIFKEHEFIYEDDNTFYNGIIDLVLVEDDIVKIIDYKLKNIDDEHYLDQLNVYYDYMKTVTNKQIKLYLYSILNDELKEIK